MIRREAAPRPPVTDSTAPSRRLQPGPAAAAPAPSATPLPPPPAPPRQRRKRRWGRKIVLFVQIGTLLIGGGILGGAVWFENSLRREPVLTDYSARPGSGRGTNWLLVGSDSRQGLSAEQQEDLATGGDIGSGRTDTILLVHLPGFGSSTPATMVSIPRDSYVAIPGRGKDKINAAFAEGGAPLLIQTVEQATGLRLDHYAEIGFSGFAALVDALGGVTMCLADPISDPLAGIDLPAGCQQLNGRNALGFVRSRAMPRADLDRMTNQRQFMSALLHRAASPSVWLNPWRWYSVPRAAVGALTVDRDDHIWDLMRLGWALHGAITTMTVPIGEFSNGDAGSVVIWDHDAARALFEALGADGPIPASARAALPTG